MRTKTSILCAVLVAAGVATSMAQTYSQNIVGYVNLVQSPGFRIIANPLNTTNNDVSNLFKNPPPGLALFKFNGFGYDSSAFDPDAGGWTAPLVLAPGTGAWLQVPAGAPYTNTFVGDAILNSTNSLPAGYSIRSAMLPQAGLIQTTLNYPVAPGDAVYFFNGFGYDSFAFDPDAGGWTPSEPTVNVAQGFWNQNNSPTKNWIRNFTP